MPAHKKILYQLEKLRKRIINEVPVPAERKALLGQLVSDKSFEYFTEKGPDEWRDFADKLMSGENRSREV